MVTLKKEKNSKILKIAVPAIVIGVVGVGIWKFPGTRIENIESTWKIDKENKYDIGGKYTNKEIGNSIIGGCYLEQYIEAIKSMFFLEHELQINGEPTKVEDKASSLLKSYFIKQLTK